MGYKSQYTYSHTHTHHVAPDLEHSEGQDHGEEAQEERDEGVVEGEQQHQHEGQLPGLSGGVADPDETTFFLFLNSDKLRDVCMMSE